MGFERRVFQLLGASDSRQQKSHRRQTLDIERYDEDSIGNLEITDEFKNAFSAMEESDQNIFITGKAGTGKSTLLRYFRENTSKNVAVLAPTGVASINIGGQTIHSFFKFPPHFIQKDNIRRRKNSDVIKKLDTVIIDEVSMVRADLMDGIDYAMRINRDEMRKPFGGAQVIFFGDLFQLPPIVEKDMKTVFDEQYDTPYFFSARVFDKLKLQYIELTKIFRQTNRRFLELLNNIRCKEHTEEDLDLLNERVNKKADISNDSPVILTTTNNQANAINEHRLAQLPGHEYKYEAIISGEFDENSYPTESVIRLKKNAQVILIKNDPKRRWVNGTLGRIASLSKDEIRVEINGAVYDVTRSRWDKIEYVYNSSTEKIDENIKGSFEQYPIKLAWAITIHKSQGQTFDKLIIDLGYGAFTHGQVYVALSRCTSLDGIMLKRPVIHSDIIFDKRIYEFRNRFTNLF